MSLLHVSQLSYRHPVQPDWLFRGVTFDLNPGERTAIIGPNGSGKTTLLRILSGQHAPAQGEIIRRSGLVIAHAEQEVAASPISLMQYALSSIPEVGALYGRMTMLEDRLADESCAVEYAALVGRYAELGGYEHEAQVARVLAGIGFSVDDQQLCMSELSGGQRTRAGLARMLLMPADIVLLDEPTNHLDLGARQWLEQYMTTLDAAIVVVSHDRRFLQSSVTRILEVRRGRVTSYAGGYDWYRAQLELEHQQAVQDYHAQERREKAAQRAAQVRMQLAKSVSATPTGVRHGKDFYAAKAARVQRAAKVIQAREARRPRVAMPFVEVGVRAPVFAVEDHQPEHCLAVEGLSKSFGAKELFADVSFRIGAGERVAIVGPNGSGKSTLVKIVLGHLSADRGTVVIGQGVRIGYFSQDGDTLDPNKRALDLSGHDTLGGLRFSMDRARARIASLSAGERAKVAIASLLATSPNFLVLDEPTNHLDIDTQEALERALTQFTGAMLLVSHDRQLIDALATSAIDLATG